jgi:hypothetical protein
MKRRFLFVRQSSILLAGFLLLTFFLFSACKKSLDTFTQPPGAGLMAFNLVPDKQAVEVTIGGNSLTNPLAYTNYTGTYRSVYVGNRDVMAYDVYSGATLATTNQLFQDSAYYSLFVLGANGNYKNLIVKDSLENLASTTGEAFVRYVNAIPDSVKQPLVTISSNGTDVFKNNAPFASVSNFKAITPGNVSVQVNDESINSSRTIAIEQGKVYTILLVGIPQTTDSTKAVQIKFIQNGAITP